MDPGELGHGERVPFRGILSNHSSRNSLLGPSEDVAEEHRRIRGKDTRERKQNVHPNILSLSVQLTVRSTYILHTVHIHPNGESERKGPIEQTPHRRRSRGHIGPQGPHLASPQEQAISAGMDLTIHLSTIIGQIQRDRLMKENEAPNSWAQSHAPDGFRANAGGDSDRPFTIEEAVHAEGWSLRG